MSGFMSRLSSGVLSGATGTVNITQQINPTQELVVCLQPEQELIINVEPENDLAAIISDCD